jgi:hypothetical protein
MIYPTVHLNGTSKKELIEQWEKAHDKLLETFRFLKEATPHGRDYYKQGPNVIFEAVKQHDDMMLGVAKAISHSCQMLKHLNKL